MKIFTGAQVKKCILWSSGQDIHKECTVWYSAGNTKSCSKNDFCDPCQGGVSLLGSVLNFKRFESAFRLGLQLHLHVSQAAMHETTHWTAWNWHSSEHPPLNNNYRRAIVTLWTLFCYYPAANRMWTYIDLIPTHDREMAHLETTMVKLMHVSILCV